MTKMVIDGLHVVDVQGEHGKGAMIASNDFELMLGEFMEQVALTEPRERIAKGNRGHRTDERAAIAAEQRRDRSHRQKAAPELEGLVISQTQRHVCRHQSHGEGDGDTEDV